MLVGQEDDYNYNTAINGWCVSNGFIVLGLFIEEGEWTFIFFFSYVLSLLYMTYMNKTKFVENTLWVAGVSAMCLIFAANGDDVWEGWATFFGVMTGVAGLYLLIGLCQDRENVKKNNVTLESSF